MFVTIHHPASGGTAQVHERTVPGWERAGWTTKPLRGKRARERHTKPPTTAPPALGEVTDDSIAGPSSTTTEEI